MKSALILLLVLCFTYQKSYAQHDLKWLATSWNSVIDFTQKDTVKTSSHYEYFLYTAGPLSSVYDSISNTLIFTNSVDIVSDKGDTVAGTENLLDPVFRNEYPAGPSTFNFTLLLPKRGSEYYIINRSGSGVRDTNYHQLLADRTYYGVFDMAKGAHGEVTSSKNILVKDVVASPSFLSAVRHANGRDFWIVQRDWIGNTFYVFRSSPTEIVLDHVQTIGDSTYFLDVIGSGGFSANGTKMGYTCISQYPQIYDFDRCTGYFSKVMKLQVPAYQRDGSFTPSPTPQGQKVGQVSINFSPSGRYAYINNYYRIYQYDLEAGDSAAIMATEVLIAKWDSSYLNWGNSIYPFANSLMGPNNKLYYCSYGGYPKNLHVIHHPDSAGLACGFELFGLPLNAINNSDLPNVPYYNLKALAGSGCDTIVSGIGNLSKTPIGLRVYPNPATQHITVAIANNVQSGTLTILDALGQEMIKETITQQNTTFSVQQWSAGIYFVEVRTKQGEVGVVKFVKEE